MYLATRLLKLEDYSGGPKPEKTERVLDGRASAIKKQQQQQLNNVDHNPLS